MKKLIVGLVMMFVFAITLPLSVEAHNGCSRHRRSYSSRSYRSRAASRYYAPRRAAYYAPRGGSYYVVREDNYRRPSFYRRHRNLINLGLATGGGAIIGALLGGKRGALIGTGVGAASGAVYTYGINKKRRRY